ncbi:MAG: helix-turn-helix transcriptional regulator [Oscillospiraceae bacterium]
MKNPEQIEAVSIATGIPMALYRGEVLVCAFSCFLPNPAFVLLNALRLVPDGLYYTVTPSFFICGGVRSGTDLLLLGPVSSHECSPGMAKKLLTRLGESTSRENQLFRYLRGISPCNITRFRGTLLLLTDLLNISVPRDIHLLSLDSLPQKSAARDLSSPPFFNTLGVQLEKQYSMAVEAGNLPMLETLLEGNLDDFSLMDKDAIRSFKNNFIMATAVVARMAVRGGLNYSTAMTICDEYLFHIEKQNSFPELLDYFRLMFRDFTRRVAAIKSIDSHSLVVVKIDNYIKTHINEKIQTCDIAEFLSMNRSYLCRHFKENTGMTITAYITREKIKGAARLLRYTELSLFAISTEMGFSTQHYFHTVFKKEMGITPLAYRAHPTDENKPLQSSKK